MCRPSTPPARAREPGDRPCRNGYPTDGESRWEKDGRRSHRTNLGNLGQDGAGERPPLGAVKVFVLAIFMPILAPGVPRECAPHVLRWASCRASGRGMTCEDTPAGAEAGASAAALRHVRDLSDVVPQFYARTLAASGDQLDSAATVRYSPEPPRRAESVSTGPSSDAGMTAGGTTPARSVASDGMITARDRQMWLIVSPAAERL